ncbi:MAG: NAD(+)/NADH kinase [Phenylobacterium sp.]|uniref:diacylglycerol/lipid kinase family protein n=1 Tax=Phenylobacterium sp. TaxID=1871053 RepID=UPI001A3582D9|nr:diacylglycerol kinase family protein [Phenylobacterium sp.]MBJ7409390.1 NAD(+)/NADH kinase [Phenylobacterium sp.]
MRLSQTPAVDLKTAKIAAVVNAASGRCSRGAGEALSAEMARQGLAPAHLWCGLGADLERALDKVLEESPDVLIVLGGDGTIRSVAQRCDTAGPLLLPLPGGTMNILPRALYGTRTWRRALHDVLAAPEVRPVNGAQAGGHRFFAAAIFGGPSLLQEAREAVRYGEFALAAQKGIAALRSAFDRELICVWDGKDGAKGEAVAVLCPIASRRLSPSEPRLEAAVVHPEGPVDALRLVLSAAFRDWRADPDVRCAKAERIEVLGGGPFPGLLDGERFTFEGPLQVELVPEAFLALTPGSGAERKLS